MTNQTNRTRSYRSTPNHAGDLVGIVLFAHWPIDPRYPRSAGLAIAIELKVIFSRTFFGNARKYKHRHDVGMVETSGYVGFFAKAVGLSCIQGHSRG